MTEEEFLKTYDMGAYPRPSVTVDQVILAFDGDEDVSVLLIRRGGHPHKGRWGLPGGFVHTGPTLADQESADAAAARELAEETSLTSTWCEQFHAYTEPGRDPRGHVMSIAYVGAVPTARIGDVELAAGDDARDAKWFRLRRKGDDLTLTSDDGETLEGRDLAFDHARIISDAVAHLATKLRVTDVATHFVGDGETFSMPQVRKFCESILSIASGEDVRLDPGNFHRDFRRIVEAAENGRSGPRGAALWRRREPSTGGKI